MNNKMVRIEALIKKELVQIVRDPSSIFIAFVLPLILLFIYGYGISLDVRQLKTGLIIEDSSPAVQSFVSALEHSAFFDLRVDRNREFFFQQLLSGDLHSIVVVPGYFSKFLYEPYEQAPLQTIVDGSSPNTARIYQNYIRGAYMNWMAQEGVSQASKKGRGVVYENRFWFNEKLDSHYFIVPGSIAIIMTLIGTLLTSFVVAREWERGTMEALLSTPITIGEILISKLVPYFCLGMLSMLMCTSIAILFFGIPFRGSWLLLIAISSIFMLAALGSGLFISTMARNQFIASQAAIVSAYLPAFMLSGFVFEIKSMPSIIQIITYLIPARYIVSSLQTIFLAGNIYSVVLWDSLMLLVFSTVLFSIIKIVSRKRLD